MKSNPLAKTSAFAVAFALALGVGGCGSSEDGGASTEADQPRNAGRPSASSEGGTTVQLPNGETTIAVNDTQLFVRVLGRGEPLLIVHGGPGLDQSYLRPGMDELAQSYTLIYYDQRASGRSSANLRPDQISLALFLADMDGIRAHFDLERVNVLGHSFGGLLAMQYALVFPDRVRKLVLSSSTAASSDLRQQEAQALTDRLTDADRSEQARILNSEAFVQRESSGFEEYFRFIFGKEFADPNKASLLNLSLPENFAQNGELLGGLAADFAVYDFHDAMKGIQAPTLILYGDHEATQVAQTRIHESIPGSKLVRLENCGHFPFIEQPEAYSAEIRSFLTGG